jgi:hypothetical protein
MDYRILIRTVNVNVAGFDWFKGAAGPNPWETDDEQKALHQYQNLLKQHPAENLTLVQIVPVDIQVTRP